MLARANGIDIHYRIDGREGAPWLTFITGIANDLSMWDGQIAPLQNDFRILRYDFRGHGATPAIAGDYALDDLIGDLVGLWDALGIDKSHVCGLGLGGSMMHGLALQHPERLHSLAFCCCRASMSPDFAAMWPKFIALVKEHGSLEPMVEPTLGRWFTPEFRAANPELMESVRKMIRGTDPLGYYGVIAAFLSVDYEPRIHQIRTPAVYIGGAHDQVGGPPDILKRVSAKVPGATYVPVPDASHIANLQNPEGFNAALGAFLRAQIG
jgi:3-oxoadipate enol-lactonase